VLRKTLNESKNKDEIDIMKLSFDLVKNFENEKDFAHNYQQRVKLMCETDVHLDKNFSLRMKEGIIDSDKNLKRFIYFSANYQLERK
jgi:hypothetical protein